MDEHPDSMNDGGLWSPDTPFNMQDAPATYHNGAAGVAMADGHCEMHRWTGATMNRPSSLGGLAVSTRETTSLRFKVIRTCSGSRTVLHVGQLEPLLTEYLFAPEPNR
jgi:prepilin-type processing-associated H-X9-DG protein